MNRPPWTYPSLLTGDPLLLIGPHGCGKTYLASRVAQALRRRFMAYDASKAMFEDVLGYPNLEKLKQGMVDYVPGPLTIWDKEMILIDELNRALPELQSKWLEILRSRRIMGLPTRVRWVWAAMNPNTYTGTQELDQALLGRFALYVYPPCVLEMSEADRIKVTQAMSDDDAPALREWLYADRHRPSQDGERTSQSLTATVPLTKTLHSAARHYGNLREDLGDLVKSRGWQQLVTGERDITALAYIALQVEARRPGTIPAEMLKGLSGKIWPQKLSTRHLPPLQGEEIEYLDQMEELLNGANGDLERVVTLERVGELAEAKHLSAKAIRETLKLICLALAWLGELLGQREPVSIA